MEVIHIQPILHLLLIGGGGEGSIWVKSRSCSKAVPTLQHTIYGKQNKRSRKIGFEHYRPKRIIVNTSCSAQGLPWAPSAFKAEKGNIKLEQRPGLNVCFLTHLDGAVSTCGRAQGGHCPSLPLALHLAPSLPVPARARPRGKHGSAPQGCPLPPRHPQPARRWDGSVFLAPSNRHCHSGRGSRGQCGYQRSRNTLLHRPGFQRAGARGTAPLTRQTGMQAYPLRSGITARSPRGRAQGTRASLQGGRGSGSGCTGPALPSLPPAQPPPPSRSSIANPQAAPAAS